MIFLLETPFFLLNSLTLVNFSRFSKILKECLFLFAKIESQQFCKNITWFEACFNLRNSVHNVGCSSYLFCKEFSLFFPRKSLKFLSFTFRVKIHKQWSFLKKRTRGNSKFRACSALISQVQGGGNYKNVSDLNIKLFNYLFFRIYYEFKLKDYVFNGFWKILRTP